MKYSLASNNYLTNNLQLNISLNQLNFFFSAHYSDSSPSNSNVFCTEVDNILEVNNCENQIEWVLDSGCTDHIINNESYYSNSVILENPIDVKIGNGTILKATKIGEVIVYFLVNNQKVEVKLTNVFYVKEMDRNLISYGKVTKLNKIISKDNTSKIYNKNNELIAVAYKVNNMYKMNSLIENTEIETYTSSFESDNMTMKEKFHRMLGHVNFNYLNIIFKNKLVDGIPVSLESDYLKCGTCIQNKMHNLSFKRNKRRRARDLLEIVHTDLNGPHSTTGNRGETYFLTFIDDYSKIAKLFTIKSKTEVYNCFLEYINQVENLTGKKIKRLRCDNGKEYINQDIFRLAREKGIFIEPCPPYVHELNGTAERYSRSVMDTARCLLADAKVHTRFWPEVVKTAAYLKNRTLANTIKRKTPYEIMFGEKPNISNLKLYGSKVFVRIPEVKRENKWASKANLGILIGYEDVGYRVLINNKVITARHVDVIEDNVKLVGFQGDDSNNEQFSDDKN